jgi:hypothetical protein
MGDAGLGAEVGLSSIQGCPQGPRFFSAHYGTAKAMPDAGDNY